MVNLFSPAALFICFRETLEAVLVITIMLQICDRLKLSHLKRQVWIGAFCGLGIAIAAAIVFVCLFWVAQNKAFSGSGQTIFEGFMFLIASYLLTIVAMAMLKFKNYERKIEAKLLDAARVNSKAGKSGIFLLAFSTTLREGLETAVFITGSNTGQGAASIPLAGLVGVICGLLIGLILYYTGKQVSNIAWFMIVMAVIMFGLAAGLTSRAIVAFQSVGWFGYAGLPLSARPWQTQQLWDWTPCCSSDITKNFFFGLIGTLFGYTDTGTAMWCFAFFGYWVDICLVLAIKGYRGTLNDAKAKYDKRHQNDPAVIAAANQVNKDLHPGHPHIHALPKDLETDSDLASTSRGSTDKEVPLQDPPGKSFEEQHRLQELVPHPKELELSQV